MAMSEAIERIDDYGRPAWLALMVLGFIVFWPVGLVILAYLIGSGRMGCGRHSDVAHWQERAAERWERKRQRFDAKIERWERRWGRHASLRPTGNRAFDEYREEALKRLEEEAAEFRNFLDRLRMARDRAEFDEFMRDRRNRTANPGGDSNQGPPPAQA